MPATCPIRTLKRGARAGGRHEPCHRVVDSDPDRTALTSISAPLQGSYTAVHVFGWTEFEIDPLSKELLITTWGIEPYNEEALLADPEAIIARDPEIISQFAVAPGGGLVCEGDLDGNGIVNGFDLAQILGAWGACGDCTADLSGDGIVDQADVALLLGGWGGCS